jgi:hypothetical protein
MANDPIKFFGAQSILSSWVEYTPTFTGFGTPTNVKFYSRRVGGSLEVKGRFNPGSSTPTEARITVGHNGVDSNVTIDTLEVPPVTVLGAAGQTAASGSYFGLYAISPSSNQKYVNLGVQTSGASLLTAINGDALGGTTITLEFSVPILEWA